MDDRTNGRGCIEVLSWIAVDEGAPRRAARMMGAVEGLTPTSGGPSTIYPDLLIHHDRCEQEARRAIGDHAFETEFRRGLVTQFDDATAYALDEKGPTDTTSVGPGSTALTRREQEVAELVAEGLTNRSIADKLVISQRTAQGHVEHILSKLGFTSRTQIAAWVIERRQGEQS
ncbi:putative LuxR family transcriptional regulator [Rhodococcus wratislaviensis NBRC 100605]|uniref:Putative LuxR family transcriptional regulator n=1 Tax=Rhodococcus wratislaviensis NBRC 100605 TaxID=1219028 RepID=X0QE18_RHOWR|nr:putative LuxR family transcriptional regulator [Rhodococcus wratislaviensis NBRC 100605]